MCEAINKGKQPKHYKLTSFAVYEENSPLQAGFRLRSGTQKNAC